MKTACEWGLTPQGLINPGTAGEFEDVPSGSTIKMIHWANSSARGKEGHTPPWTFPPVPTDHP